MSRTCARCASPLAAASVSCTSCGAQAVDPSADNEAPRWGGLDIERTSAPRSSSPTTKQSRPAVPPRPRPGAATVRASVPGARPAVDHARIPALPARMPRTAPVANRSVTTPAQIPGMLSNAESNDVLDTGMISLGDAFSAQQTAAESSLDLVSMPPPKARAEPLASITEAVKTARSSAPPSAPPSAPSGPTKRQELADYGPIPAKLIQTVPYFFRVLMRKRVLDAELAALSLHRKHLDAQAEEALCVFAEALYALRKDPRLSPLEKQLRVVADSQQQVGAREEDAQQAETARKRELDELANDVQNIEAKAAPVRSRESELQAQADALKTRIRGKEELVRKTEAEIQTLKKSTDAGAIDRIAALTAERDARLGEAQSLNVQLLPLQEDLSGLRRELAKLMATASALHDEERNLSTAAGREHERSRVSIGGARSAYQQVLRSLAEAGLRAKLAELAPAKARTATDAMARAAAKRESEELHRAATESYDAAKYQQGMFLLVGGTGLVFLLFAGLIIF